MRNQYQDEILDITRKISNAVNGEYIFPAGDRYTMVVDLQAESVKVYDKQTELLTDFTGEGLEAGIFEWVQDNQYNIPNTLQSKIIDEVLIPEPADFISDPVSILALNPETGKLDMPIGVIGEVREPTPEGQVLRKVLFLSPDGSWVTLSCWYEGDEASKELAQGDVGLIGDAMSKFKIQ